MFNHQIRRFNSNDTIDLNETAVKIKYGQEALAVYLQPRVIYEWGGSGDALLDLGLDIKPSSFFSTQLLLSTSSLSYDVSALYFRIIEEINDPHNTGTKVVVSLDRVGTNYRRASFGCNDLIALNNFNRYILDGTVDFGFKLRQKLLHKLSLDLQSDYVVTDDYNYGQAYPGTYFLWQLGLGYDFSPNLALEYFYRQYEVPSGVDQFSNQVAKSSGLFGLACRAAF